MLGETGKRRSPAGAWSPGPHPLRRLQVIAVTLPAAVVVAAEVLALDTGGTAALAALVAGSTLAISAFGAGMFHLINRALTQVLADRQALAAAHELSLALLDAHEVGDVALVARERVLRLTGARDVKVSVWEAGRSGTPPAGSQADVPPAEAIVAPLVTEGRALGQLVITPHPADRRPIGDEALRAIAEQIARALRAAQVEQRRRGRDARSRKLYELLLEVSTQQPLPQTLNAICQVTLDVLPARAVTLHVNDQTARELLTAARNRVLPDFAAGEHDPTGHSHAIAVTSADGAAFGHMRVWFEDEAEPETLQLAQALGDTAAIALSAEHLRVKESQGAILDERARIARELHDSLAQVLAVTHLRLRTIQSRREIAAKPELALELGEVADTCADAYSDVREAILALHESSHRGRDLQSSLASFLAKYTQQSGVNARIECNAEHALHLAPQSELQLVRVIQEALANVRKHARADNVVVRIEQSATNTTVTITDDGRGFDPHAAMSRPDGYGLSTMRERVALLGGTLEIQSRPGWGTNVVAVIPEGRMPTLVADLGEPRKHLDAAHTG